MIMPRTRTRAAHRKLAAATFGTSDAGLAAVEFAFVLPLMLAIYLGIVELSNGLSASRKVDLVAHAMSDLTGQIVAGGGSVSTQAAVCGTSTTPLSCSALDQLTQIFGAGAALIAPLPATSLKITISEVNIQLISGVYQATVNWSASYNGGTLRNGAGCTLNTYLSAADVAPVATTSLPTSFTNSALSPAVGPVIVADVTYNYPLGLGGIAAAWLPSGSILMQRTSYSPVRNQYVNTSTTTPALFNHIQAPATTTTWTTSPASAYTNVNCLGNLSPAQQ
jgi:Flp pilus assembly protein TadG